jgi:hypothetical protein
MEYSWIVTITECTVIYIFIFFNDLKQGKFCLKGQNKINFSFELGTGIYLSKN